MPSFKSVLYFLVLLLLLTDETFLKLAMGFLRVLLANRSRIVGTIKGFLPDSAYDVVAAFGKYYEPVVAAASEYYEQVVVMVRSQMQLLAIKLTDLALWTARSAPGALCKVGSWLVPGAQVVAQWLMGDGADGAQAVVMRKQWRVIQAEVVAHCFNAEA